MVKPSLSHGHAIPPKPSGTLPCTGSTLSDRLISSCAKQRFVAASSRRTEEKVASRRGSGRHWRSASRARALSESLVDG